MWHDTGSGASELPSGGWLEPGEHAESPATKRRLKNLLDATRPRPTASCCSHRVPATIEELCRVHAPEYVERIRELSTGRGGDAGSEAPFGNGSFPIAQLAAGGTITAIDAVLDGTVDNAYALVRPPGHHALPDRGMGFCLFANVAVGVRHAQAARGLGRVAVVDWDVHHGNGTQAVFWDDPSVLAISLHQDGLYPADSGLVGEVGAGDGVGATLNVPLPAGSGTARISTRSIASSFRHSRRSAPSSSSSRAASTRERSTRSGGCSCPPLTFGVMAERLLDAAARLCDGQARRFARGWLLGGARAVLRSLRDRGPVGPHGRDRRSVRLPRGRPGPGAPASPTRRGRRVRGARRGGAALSNIKLVLVLSENWTLTPPRDLRGLVEMAVVAEEAGFDAVMVSEHIVLGSSAGAEGIMGNPRDYAMPGNQDPAMPWPSSLVLLSAIAAATTRMRLTACAVIAPLRHPLLLARELGTLDLLSEGRLVVQPTVSWHRDEYDALGVSFSKRGEILDEHLAAWEGLWRDTPASFAGEHYAYDDVYFEPKAWRPDGPRLWLGGESVHPRLLRRIVRYAHGFHPLGRPSDDDLVVLRDGLAAAGRDLAELELVGGMRAVFPDDSSPSALEPALASLPAQLERGFTTFCIKPSQFVDDLARYPAWCREVVERVGEHGG